MFLYYCTSWSHCSIDVSWGSLSSCFPDRTHVTDDICVDIQIHCTKSKRPLRSKTGNISAIIKGLAALEDAYIISYQN